MSYIKVVRNDIIFPTMHMVGKALKFPTSMSPHAWGRATHLCLQLPPQSGIC
jgi:hypothetical protein